MQNTADLNKYENITTHKKSLYVQKEYTQDHVFKCLQYKGKIGEEVRPLYFYKAMGREVVDARILSFGACNFSCPYCKRDGNFRDIDGSIISSVPTKLSEVFAVIDDALEKDQIVRLSGGDPVVYPQESIIIAKYIHAQGKTFSIAHNGSSPTFIEILLKYGLESAAIDFKAPKQEMSLRAGLKNGTGAKMYERSLETQRIVNKAGILLDVRTPIFSTTTVDDLLDMAEDIVKHKEDLSKVFRTLRIYKPVFGCDWEAPRNKEIVIWMIQKIKEKYPDLKIGLRAKWDPEGFLYF